MDLDVDLNEAPASVSVLVGAAPLLINVKDLESEKKNERTNGG